jgi:hypothetical protein
MKKSQLTSMNELIKGSVCFRVTKNYKPNYDHRYCEWKADTLIYVLHLDKLVDINGIGTEKLIPVILYYPDNKDYELLSMSTRCIFTNLDTGGFRLANPTC